MASAVFPRSARALPRLFHASSSPPSCSVAFR